MYKRQRRAKYLQFSKLLKNKLKRKVEKSKYIETNNYEGYESRTESLRRRNKIWNTDIKMSVHMTMKEV
jgi:hypothetical protein